MQTVVTPPTARHTAPAAHAVRRLDEPGAAAVHPPPLRPWSRIWRYLAAAGIGMVLWLAASVELIPPEGSVPEDAELRMGAALFLDGLLGLVSLALLPLRRRRPVLTAVTTALLTGVSVAALGGAAVAAVSMATRRRWRLVIPVAVAWVAAVLVYEVVWFPSIVDDTNSPGFVLLTGGVAIGMVATCVATGFYVGARRELLTTLRQRAETAEREQSLKAEAAREAERTRIAREMHDVLAHRISLVSMHAGALAYRTDLTREETAEAAGVIQHNAHLALTELRQVLGVLRAGQQPAATDSPAEPPQPELAQIRELVEAAEPYVDVTVDVSGLPGGDAAEPTEPAERTGRADGTGPAGGAGPAGRTHPAGGTGAPDHDTWAAAVSGLPVTTSRTAYRVVQEALTNACKHAPGSSVVIQLAGAPGGLLTVEVVNGVAASDARPSPPGAGLGLVGLAERVALAGGALEHGAGPDGSFVVRAWLPWEDNT